MKELLPEKTKNDKYHAIGTPRDVCVCVCVLMDTGPRLLTFDGMPQGTFRPEVGLYAFSIENKARSLCIFANVFLIPNTPLWRIGPPEKPVLCNACGSRWRIWRNLDDYTPKHGTRGPQQGKLPSHQTDLDDDANDGSDSGSAPRSSDNCIQLENMNETESSGNKQHT
ncbi:hypothetical protein RHGRI_032267 [Rhododendron griersonianum]|uniref:GATA-type domain-containing protein n=1 Tax=Rhododendron griersonianum TaxID=479676 RepID=A0AAV6IEY4_9ERIC|nr:hypothetical protein RHGRI_032267 [Rhododendron griersonianum]